MSSPTRLSLEQLIVWQQQQVNYYTVMHWEPDRTLASAILDQLRSIQKIDHFSFVITEDKPDVLGE